MLPTFDLLDLQPTDDPLRFRLDATKQLCTPFGFLYGGSGIAASIEARERAAVRCSGSRPSSSAARCPTTSSISR